MHSVYKKIKRERKTQRVKDAKIVSIAQECRRRGLDAQCNAAVIQSPVRELRLASCSREEEEKENTASISVILLPATTPPVLCHLYCPYPFPPSLNLLLPPFYSDCARVEARRTPRRRSCSCTTLGPLGDEQCPPSFLSASSYHRFLRETRLFPLTHLSELNTFVRSITAALRSLLLSFSSPLSQFKKNLFYICSICPVQFLIFLRSKLLAAINKYADIINQKISKQKRTIYSIRK